jgi:5-methylcytosine-specific restriction endonuclease McrA
MATDKQLKRWYGFVKGQPCAACRKHATHENPVEAAHMHLVTSRRTHDLIPRGHKGEAAWGCIPLCRRCHEEQHQIGERNFRELMRPDAAEVWGSLLLRFFTDPESPF